MKEAKIESLLVSLQLPKIALQNPRLCSQFLPVVFVVLQSNRICPLEISQLDSKSEELGKTWVSSPNFNHFGGLKRTQLLLSYVYQVLNKHTSRE